MKNQIFKHGVIITESQLIRGKILITDGKIILGIFDSVPDWLSEEEAEVIDCHGLYLSPGFIDIHCHGGGNADFMDGTAADICQAARTHGAHGTTSIAPTSLTSSDEELFAFFDAYREAKNVTENMPNLIGIHLEGPYFAPEQAGAQPPKYLSHPTPAHYKKILACGSNDILRWSVAPELPGALELGDELRRRGIYGSIGHSNASLDVVKAARDHGYSQLTHLYSAMSTITRVQGHRKLGITESAYLFDDLDAEIIADGIHLPPELLRMIVKCKSLDHLCLVTDAMRGAGMPEGPSLLGSRTHGIDVVIQGGIAHMPDFTSFAGSVATTDRMVRVMTKEVGLSLVDAVRLASTNPARFVGLEKERGRIAPGLFADLLLFDEQIQIHAVFINGIPMMQ